MEDILISFCLPVYNQTEMVCKCVEGILRYPGHDIEVVINDDCSTEDILALSQNFGDQRVRYFRNTENMGHDLNIIQSFRNARAPFAFLLRVRDRIIAEGIPAIIDRIKQKPSLAYLTGNALNEDGDYRIIYSTPSFQKGYEALCEHKRLYFHPSGGLYAINLLDLDKEENFIRSNIDSKYGFLIHNMMRLELSVKGDFELICDTPIWCYTDTFKATDIAVNSDKKKVSVFAPQYVEQRFLREMEWADLCLPNKLKVATFQWLIKKYLDLNTWGFKRRNEEPALQRHYNCEKMKFSVAQEQKRYRELAAKKIASLSLDENSKNKLLLCLKRCVLINSTYAPVRFYLAKLLRHTFVYTIYKKRNVQRGVT